MEGGQRGKIAYSVESEIGPCGHLDRFTVDGKMHCMTEMAGKLAILHRLLDEQACKLDAEPFSEDEWFGLYSIFQDVNIPFQQYVSAL